MWCLSVLQCSFCCQRNFLMGTLELYCTCYLYCSVSQTSMYCYTYMCSVTCHSGSCTLTSGISIMELVMSWRLLELKVILSWDSQHNQHFALAVMFWWEPRWCQLWYNISSFWIGPMFLSFCMYCIKEEFPLTLLMKSGVFWGLFFYIFFFYQASLMVWQNW